MSKLKRLASKERQAVNKVGVLNLNKINVKQILNFMFRVKIQTIPATFHENVTQIHHKYPTGLCHGNIKEPTLGLILTKYAVSSRGPRF